LFCDDGLRAWRFQAALHDIIPPGVSSISFVSSFCLLSGMIEALTCRSFIVPDFRALVMKDRQWFQGFTESSQRR
jgi:hypothetical protein